MMSGPEQRNDGFFNNDPSQPVQRANDVETSQEQPNNTIQAAKPIKTACLVCRKRRIRCDGIRPTCSTCLRLGHDCGYTDVRRKSGPRRGHVRELEARLHQVEHHVLRFKNDSSQNAGEAQNGSITGEGQNGTDSISQDLISLGLEEPLPSQELMDELNKLYFETVHKSIPMIHKYRYLAASNLQPSCRPPVCLRYAMWTLACSVTERYAKFTEIFYRRARKYIDIDEMKGHGECFVSLGHAQTWALIASFEFKTMYFPRAWMSVGRTSRLVQMLGLQRVDHEGLEVKKTLGPPKNWVEREERRRTFWLAYCNDRYASIGTGWPMTFEEKDIYTHLPASLDAFEEGKPEPAVAFAAALTSEGAQNLSALGAIVVVASIFGENLNHLHRSYDNDDHDDTTNGGFWKRHRRLDNLLSTITIFMPDRLRIPTDDPDPNIPFLNMALHTAVICLHQAAILKAETHKLGDDLIQQSVMRCFDASVQVHNIMQHIKHISMGRLHPFMAFCLYVAARVLIHAHKKRQAEVDIRDKYELLLKAMQSHMLKTPLTSSFLGQLQLELDAAGLDNPLKKIEVKVSVLECRTCTTDFELPIEPFLERQPPTMSPVVPIISETQPTIHEVRVAQTLNSQSFVATDIRPVREATTMFDLPPRLKARGDVASHSSPSDSASNKTDSPWPNPSMDVYQMYDANKTAEAHIGVKSSASNDLNPSIHAPFSPVPNGPGQLGQISEADQYFGSAEFMDLAGNMNLNPAFAAVTDWTVADPSMNSLVADTDWTQLDAMSWESQGIEMHGGQ